MTVALDYSRRRNSPKTHTPIRSKEVTEAKDLRDEEEENYFGKSVEMACSNVNSYLGPLLLTQELEDTEQEEIDKYLIDVDGSPDKSCVGGNAILAISMAVCKAGAARKGVPVYRHIADIVGVKDVVLPVPMFNMINGGAHAGNKLCMQVIAYFSFLSSINIFIVPDRYHCIESNHYNCIEPDYFHFVGTI